MGHHLSKSPLSVTDHHVQALREILGEEAVLQHRTDRLRYAQDETERLTFLPEVVVLPTTTQQVSHILAFAHQNGLAVTPRGAGTGLSGGALPVCGGLLLSVERLNRIRHIDSRNLVVETETGVVTGDLQRQVEEVGLFYPPDPASRDTCLLAGNLAEDSAGPRSCKYGSTRKWVLGLEAVMADGTVLQTGGKNRKDVAGYNLTQLLIGSEGTLAVLTAATLRLIRKPAHSLTLLLPFPDLEKAAATIEVLFRQGHDPAACELMEEKALEAVGRVLTLPTQLRGQAAILLVELDGDDPEILLEEAMAIGRLTEKQGGGDPIVAQDSTDQRRLWAIRRKIGEAVKHGSVYKEADTVVPRSRLVELVRAARWAAQSQGLTAVCYGHAGDGNLHINLLRGKLSDQEWQKRRDAAEEELFSQVIALGGSITGEHGIGFTQRAFLPQALGHSQVELQKRLKAVFDPQGILNPGKIFLDHEGC